MRTLALVLLLGLASCQSAYYGTMEVFGHGKRGILAERVEEARDQQELAKEEFQTAFEAFQELLLHTGGEFEDLYASLKDEFRECESEAEDVGDPIDDVEEVAKALFEEWEEDLKEISDPDAREQSEKQLAETKTRCTELVAAMRKSEKAMKPVLASFGDRMRFLEKNLNPRAIASLKGPAATLQADIRKLTAQMDASIRKADEFLDGMP